MLPYRSSLRPLALAEIVDALDGRALTRLDGPCTAHVLGVHCQHDEHWVQIATQAVELGDTDTVVRLVKEFGARQ